MSEEKKFDLRTHIMDPKTGKMVKVQPYRLHISAEFGHVYERDGKKFYPNGEPWIDPRAPKVAETTQAEVPAAVVTQSKSVSQAPNRGSNHTRE
jgi:hypothetical protein